MKHLILFENFTTIAQDEKTLALFADVAKGHGKEVRVELSFEYGPWFMIKHHGMDVSVYSFNNEITLGFNGEYENGPIEEMLHKFRDFLNT